MRKTIRVPKIGGGSLHGGIPIPRENIKNIRKRFNKNGRLFDHSDHDYEALYSSGELTDDELAQA